MTASITTVGNSYTLVGDFTGKYVRQIVVTRDEETTLYLAFSDSASGAEYIVTPSFLGIELQATPSGGRLFAKTIDSGKTSSVLVNWN